MTADRSRVCSTAPFGMAPRVTALVGRSYSLSAASRSLFSYTWEGTWSSVVKPGILGLNPIWERHCRHEQLVLSARLLSRSGCRWPACPGRTPTGTPEPSGSEKPSALKMDTSSTIRMLDSADMNSRHHRADLSRTARHGGDAWRRPAAQCWRLPPSLDIHCEMPTRSSVATWPAPRH